MIRKRNFIIKYKWENGSYSLEDMINLVLKNVITEEQFFSITRYNFNGVKDKKLKN